MTGPVRRRGLPPRGLLGPALVVLGLLLPALGPIVGGTLHAQEAEAPASGAPELVDLFPSTAPIRLGSPGSTSAGGASPSDPSGGPSSDATGLARLVLPPEVLAACRPDLSDLRILDPDGGEVAYLVDAGRAGTEGIRVLERRTPPILGADRRTVEGETDRVDHVRESYTLPTPPAAPPGQGWSLVLVTGRDRFVRSLVVTDAGAAEADRSTPLAEGSIFRLAPADGGIRGGANDLRERLEIRLPDELPERITVTLEGEGNRFLEPGFRYERSRSIPGIDRARVPLEVLGVRSEGGRTTVELERPAGLVPDLLVLGTTTAAYSRRVEVWDEGPGAADLPLGSATLFRVPAPSWMDAPIEDRSVPLARPRGDRLRVVIDDADSPPLSGLTFRAALRQPSLVFAVGGGEPRGRSAAPGGPADRVGTLLFGGGRVFRPRYDLQALLPDLSGAPRTAEEAEAALRVVDPERLAPARLGPIEPNPRYDPAPALAFAHRPGAPVEARLYRHRRTLSVPASDDGLARLTLAPEDLARARPDLADLRIVGDGTGGDDGDGGPRQWAYLLDDLDGNASGAWRDLPIVRRDGEEPGTSRYGFELPARPATLDRLTIDSDAPFFDRPYTLRVLRPETEAGQGSEDGETILLEGRLRRRPGDPRPVTLAFPATRVETVTLEVRDGSDAPLTLRRAEGRFPLPTVYFPAPAGDYALLFGHPEATAPSYELTRARDLVFAVAAVPAEASPVEDNPAYSRTAGLLAGDGPQHLLLWGALLLAVLVLAVFTLRLARREE